VTENESIGPVVEAFGGTPAKERSEPSIESVFATQRETAIALRTSTAHMRIEKLRRLEEAVLANRDAIYRALAAELRESEAEANLFDLLQVISGIRHAIRNLTGWMKPKRAAPTMTMFRARIHYEPWGVALIISPWNYPISLLSDLWRPLLPPAAGPH
jgi:aldehyde dehydrogenase (NAD+)